MEGLLVILVSAISLSLFMQKQQKEGTINKPNPYFFWDEWAKQENFSFTPPTVDAPMNIVATISPYTVYIYAKDKEHPPDAPKAERYYTEIRVPLRYTLASGLWIQARKGLEKIRLTKTATLLQFQRGNLDEILFAEAKDPHTGQWVLDQPEYREILDLFKELPVKSRLEQRNLVWACESMDIADVAEAMAKAVQAANTLDTESVKAWKHWSEELNWTMNRQHGYPMLWGKHNDVRIQISIPDNLRPSIEFNAEFPPTFPSDLGLWGFEHLKDGHNIPRIANDLVWFQQGEHPRAESLPQNKVLLTFLESIFKERPKSSLVKGVLKVSFVGKKNTDLDKYLKQWLELCAHLQTHFSPPPTEEDIMEVLDGVS